MSQDAMNDFLDRIRRDRDLAARLSAAIGVKDGEAGLAALVRFATQCGFDVTVDDVPALRARFAGVRGEDGELVEDELDGVTGGRKPLEVACARLDLGMISRADLNKTGNGLRVGF